MTRAFLRSTVVLVLAMAAAIAPATAQLAPSPPPSAPPANTPPRAGPPKKEPTPPGPNIAGNWSGQLTPVDNQARADRRSCHRSGRMIVVALSIAALLISGNRMTFAQPASRPPVMRLEEGRLTALQKKTASCRTEGAGKGLNDQDLRDYVTFCAQEARLACLKQAAEQKVRGRERVSFVDKCLRGE